MQIFVIPYRGIGMNIEFFTKYRYTLHPYTELLISNTSNLPSLFKHMSSISSSERKNGCSFIRLVTICLRAEASGRGMYNLFTNLRRAASSIS